MPSKTSRVQLLTSPAAARLMSELVARVIAAADGGESVAVVAPTTRLLDACRAALLRESPVVANVAFFHHRSLAIHAIDRAFLHGLRETPAPRLLSDLEADALVVAAIRSLGSSSALRALCDERPRFAASLRRTLAELREAIVSPKELARAGASKDLVALHAAHDDLLAKSLRDVGACDAAAHALEGAESLRALAKARLLPWTRFVHHGGTELVGVQARLVGELASALPTIVLAPSSEGPAHATSRRGLARWPGVEPTRLDGATLVQTDALFEENAVLEALPPKGAVEAFHVRGTRAEIELAARICAQAHLERGVPLEDLAVVARSLEAWAGHLEAAFDAQGVPFTTSATAPLLREPWARTAATLLEALAADLPRPLVAELLRSPWTKLDDKTDPSRIAPDLWDEWTLQAGVLRGARAHREDVLAWHEADLRERSKDESPEWAAARRARIEGLGDVAAKLDAAALRWSRCATHAEHATALADLLGHWLRAPQPRTRAASARAAVLGLLDDLARLPGAASMREVHELLADSLASATTRLGSTDGSGVRVLSAMPARAIPFREIVLIGLTQGSFPRRPRHDPFLDDRVRESLRATSPAIGVKAEGRDEERQLLALVLGAATERLHVAWQRADEDGGVRAPSLFLREIARVALGRPDMEALVGRDSSPALPVTSVPGHPAAAARLLRERFGRTTLRDAMLEAAGRSHRRRAIEAIARREGAFDDALADALATVALVESFSISRDPATRAAQLRHDGVLGPGIVNVPEPMSASQLQVFGRCALQWFFTRALGLPQRDEEPDPMAVASDELGTCVHEVLEAVNREAIAQGGDPAHLITKKARRIARERWDAAVARLAGSRRELAPLAWEMLASAWARTLDGFLEEDARRLAAEGARIAEAEAELQGPLEIAHEGVTWRVTLRGRADRIVELPDGWRVEDYKTSRKVARRVAKIDVLRAGELQGLTYLLLLREWARARGSDASNLQVAFLAVHPAAETTDPAVLDVGDLEPSWRETLGVLLATWRSGAFAFRDGRCDWCDAQAACRRTHPPTKERARQVHEWTDYALVGLKNTKDRRMLADVRASLDAAEGDEA